MRPLVLCRERLERIKRVLARLGGTATMRDLYRSYRIRDWEVKQAAELGWLTVTIRKPRVGRPSYVVRFCDPSSANSFPELPLRRADIPKGLFYRHEIFAFYSVYESVHRGIKSIGIPPIVETYMRMYQPRSRAGARASVSRLLKRRDIRAARQWYYAKKANEIPRDLDMPHSTRAIWAKLEELGCWRARSGWNPWRKWADLQS